MLCRVILARIDVSEEFSVSIIRVTRIGELLIALDVTSYRKIRFLKMPHCVTFHTTEFFIVTAVITSILK
jgi:hypothetical protein